MGQVIIEVPQEINRNFRIDEVAKAEELLSFLESKKIQTLKLDLPYDLDEIDESEVLGIWSDSEETAGEIARRVRENNRKTR